MKKQTIAERAKLYSEHIGHMVNYWNGHICRGVIKTITIEPGSYGGVLSVRLEELDGDFPRKIYDEQIRNCLTCDKRNRV